MKIILSHDVDHLYLKEHLFRDLYYPSLVYRNTRGLISQNISFKLYIKRVLSFGRIHRIPELLEFYKERNIEATFFFGMSNALNLSYQSRDTEKWLKLICKSGNSVGVHGIEFNDREKIKEEYKKFNRYTSKSIFGIRTHYLRLDDNSLNYFSEQGYLFDSSLDSIEKPFKIGNMWEIPISIMDASLVENAQLNNSVEIWKTNSLARIEEALKAGLPYFVVNFHDLFFCDRFPVIQEWFIWLVDHFKNHDFEFTSFERAVQELSSL